MRDQFTIVQDVVAPGEVGSSHHLLDWQTGELITTLWSYYLVQARGGAPYTDVVPAPRKVTTVLERECFPGDKLTRGIRTVSRTRRTFTLEAALWRTEDEQVVVRTEIVTVTADRSTGRAVEIPVDMWTGIESLEQRSIPLAAPVAVPATTSSAE